MAGTAGRVTFVLTGVNTAMMKLVPPTDKKGIERYERAVKANKGKTSILFRKAGVPTAPKSTFSTDNPDLIMMIRSMKSKGKITEDHSAMAVKCPFPKCEFTVKSSTPADQTLLSTHFMEAHGDANDAAGDAE